MRARAALAAFLLLPGAMPLVAAEPSARALLTDPADQADVTTDLLALWIEDASDGIRLTMKIASLPEPPRLHVYGVYFTLAGTRVAAGWGYDESGVLHTDVGHPSGWYTKLDESLEDAHFTPGTPAYFTGTIPRSRLPALVSGAQLTDIAIDNAYLSRQRGWITGIDPTSTGASFVVGRGVVDAFPWAAAVVVAALVAGGAGATAAVVRRRRTAALRQAPPPPGPPAPPPGPHKIKIDPKRE